MVEEAQQVIARLEPLARQVPPPINPATKHGYADTDQELGTIQLLSQREFEAVHAPLLQILQSVDAEYDGTLRRAAIVADVALWPKRGTTKHIVRILQALHISGIPNQLGLVIGDSDIWDSV